MEIRRVTEAELPEAARILARAFVDDPMVRWPMGGLWEGVVLEEHMTEFFGIINRASAEAGMIWMTEDRSGVAVWLDPAATATFEEEDLEMRPLITPLTDDGGARYGAFWDWISAHIPTEPTWFLDQIGVEPGHQGRGIGAALIEHGLAMADAAGQQAFLETGNPRNVGYYERFGFKVISDDDAPRGGPHVWFMRRAAVRGA